MGAAAEYYGYLLSQGYGETQLKEFSEIAGRADRGEISHNKAYKLACKAGFGQANGESWDYADSDSDKKTFGDWVDTAQQAGWIDGAVGLIGSAIKNRKNRNDGGGGGDYMPPPPPPPQGLSAGAKIGIGVGALAVIGVIIYFVAKKK